MKYIKRLIPIIILMFLLAQLAVAVPIDTVYEKAAVGRIIGDSPEEMENQLTMENLDLKLYMEAGNVISGLGSYDSPSFALHEKFGENGVGYEMKYADAEYLDLIAASEVEKPIIVLKWKNNLATNGEVLYSPGSIISPSYTSEYQKASQFTSNWKTGFANKNPLLFMNAEYAGIYDKDNDNLLKEIGQDTITIAPTFYSSKIFPSSFACSLGKFNTLGQTFTHARNNYYHKMDDYEEFRGLAIMSYTLYGDPTLPLSVPDYDEEQNKRLCSAFYTPLEEYITQQTVTQFEGEQEELDYEFDSEDNETKILGNIEIDSEGEVVYATMQVGLE